MSLGNFNNISNDNIIAFYLNDNEENSLILLTFGYEIFMKSQM